MIMIVKTPGYKLFHLSSDKRGDLQVRGVQREREMCCKCSKYVSESEREREEECGHL